MHMLRKIVRIVKMNNSLVVSGDDVLGQKNTPSEVFRDFSRHIIPLNAVDCGIFIGIFLLYLFIITFDERKNLRVRRVGFSDEGARITIRNIFAGKDKGLHVHQAIFYHVLDFFHIDGTPHLRTLFHHVVRKRADLFF